MSRKTPDWNIYYEQHPMPDLLLTFITEYIEEHNYAPSRREMALAMGGKSTSVIESHLRYLARIGVITLDRLRPRGITVQDQHVFYFSQEEWHLMHAAWGDEIKEEILEAAGQTRFVVTG